MIKKNSKKIITILVMSLVLCSCFFINTKEVKATALEEYYNCEKSVITAAKTSSANSIYGVASTVTTAGVGSLVCSAKLTAATTYYIATKGVDATIDLVTTVQNCIKNDIGYSDCFADVVEIEKQNAAEIKKDVDTVKDTAQDIAKDLSPDVSITDKTVTTGGEGCDKIGSVGKYVTGFYNLFRYIVPALIIIFSVIDFLGVVFSGEDEKMEKAKKNFIIRLIVGILILIIPFMLEFILSAAGIIDGTIADAACNFIS